ncbi:MAG: HAD family hydrolase [Gemmatimonadaceae bacterium]
MNHADKVELAHVSPEPTRQPPIRTLFVDIGGVLLTDGWQTASRQLAAETFHLNFGGMEERHRTVFDTYEQGKLTLDDYLAWVVFFEQRSFTRTQFREFMFAQSRAHTDTIELVRSLKAKYGLKVIVLSNEARELNDYRIHTFHLVDFVDAFVSSCYVHLRKPDPDIFKLALDIAQTPANQIVYLENTALFVQIAERMGIPGIVHTDCDSTREQLKALGLW